MNNERLIHFRKLLSLDIRHGSEHSPIVAALTNDDGRELLEEIDRLRKIADAAAAVVDQRNFLSVRFEDSECVSGKLLLELARAIDERDKPCQMRQSERS